MHTLDKRELALLIIRSAEVIAEVLLDHMEPDIAEDEPKPATRALTASAGFTAAPPRRRR